MRIEIETQISCVKRELMMRRKAYPNWVQNGRMKQDTADREIIYMEAVLATLEGLRPTQQLGLGFRQ